MNPLVSVVITNFNYGKYLSTAIRSIAEQSYSPIELIVIDDASTDNSPAIIEELKAVYNNRFAAFKSHYLLQNKNINGALNEASAFISGDITVIFDADDILQPAHIETLVATLLQANKQDPMITFAYCDCNLIDEQGAFLQRGLSKPFSAALIESESFLPRPSPIFTKTLLEHFPLPENSKQDPKHFLWQNICRAENTGVYIPEPLFQYRIHNRNYSQIGLKIAAAQLSGLINKPIQLSDYWPH